MNWPGEDERVARALDGRRTPDDPELAVLVAVATRVREAGRDPRLDASPDFRDALRARLLDQVPRPRVPAESAAAPAAPGRHRQRPGPPGPPGARLDGTRRPGRRRRRGAAAVLVAAVVLSGSTLAASSGALPGDPLYGLKRRVQGVEVALARDDDARGHRHLDLARTRAKELRTAAAAGSPGPLVSALEDMDRQTRAGVRLLASAAVRRADDGRLADIASWAGEQHALLKPTAAQLPGAAQVRGAESLELLTAVLLRVGSLRDMLSCDCPAAPVDDLGPVPCAGCDTGPADRAARAAATPGAGPTGPVSVASGSVPPTPSTGPTGVPAPPPGTAAPGGPPDPGRQPTPPSAEPTPEPTPTPTPAPTPAEPPDGDLSELPGLLDGMLGRIELGGG